MTKKSFNAQAQGTALTTYLAKLQKKCPALKDDLVSLGMILMVIFLKNVKPNATETELKTQLKDAIMEMTQELKDHLYL